MHTISYCFFSNYLTHHQLPFCLEMVKLTQGNFTFVETDTLPEERKGMGYQSLGEQYNFVIDTTKGREHEEQAMALARNADVVIFGSAPEKYLRVRMKQNKLTFRYSERIFKKGEFDPLRQLKYTYRSLPNRNKSLYYLFSSAYAAKDYKRCFADPHKMFKWGYFPEAKQYGDFDALMATKQHASILWAGRLIDFKHPEATVQAAKPLKDEGYTFTLNIIGNGALEVPLKEMIDKEGLSDCVHMLGAMPPDAVRTYMEKCEIYLFTSDFNEGWGAVLNEAMNSGCAVIASHAIGSVPFLLKDGKNGYVYRNGELDDLYGKLKGLLDSPKLCRELGECAYNTVKNVWNASAAAKRLLALTEKLTSTDSPEFEPSGPCSVAEILNQDWF